VQHYRPEVVEEITGVPAAKVVELARRIARARGACPIMYTGLEYSDSGVQAIRAVFTLWALAGQLDVPGGLAIRMRENQFPINRAGLIPNPNVKKALGRDRFPVYSMYRGESHAIALPDSVLKGEPYKIRGLIVLGGSIITAWPESQVWRDTLSALDFLVTINRHHTADSAYADIVLPATTMYEITSYMTYGPIFKIREKLTEPVGEARNDYLILTELADRLGYGDSYPRTEEDLLRHVLEGSGFTLEDVREAGGEVQIPTAMMQYKKWEKGMLREDGEPGFATPSGKFEIASSILEEHGYDALPVYTEPGEGPLVQPALAESHPLVFNSGARIFADFRTQHHGVQGLSRKAPVPQVTMNRRGSPPTSSRAPSTPTWEGAAHWARRNGRSATSTISRTSVATTRSRASPSTRRCSAKWSGRRARTAPGVSPKTRARRWSRSLGRRSRGDGSTWITMPRRRWTPRYSKRSYRSWKKSTATRPASTAAGSRRVMRWRRRAGRWPRL
jgi:anaerobic selenocysteine-containing dehydrogenase